MSLNAVRQIVVDISSNSLLPRFISYETKMPVMYVIGRRTTNDEAIYHLLWEYVRRGSNPEKSASFCATY